MSLNYRLEQNWLRTHCLESTQSHRELIKLLLLFVAYKKLVLLHRSYTGSRLNEKKWISRIQNQLKSTYLYCTEHSNNNINVEYCLTSRDLICSHSLLISPTYYTHHSMIYFCIVSKVPMYEANRKVWAKKHYPHSLQVYIIPPFVQQIQGKTFDQLRNTFWPKGWNADVRHPQGDIP